MIKSKLIFEVYNEGMHTKALDLLSRSLRDRDLLEIDMMNEELPILCRMSIKNYLESVVTTSVECIVCFTPEYVPFGIIGVKDIGLKAPFYYSIINDKINEHKKSFVKESHFFTNYFVEKYGELFSYVDASSTNVIPWLERIGGVIDRDNPIEKNGNQIFQVTFKSKGVI